MKYIRSNQKGGTFFFTVVTYKRRRILCNEANIRRFYDIIAHVKKNHPFDVDAFVILHDHMHFIWTMPENDCDFSKRWMLIKKGFSMQCYIKDNYILTESMTTKREKAVWQRRFWEHQIRDERDFATHVDYIHYNPVKHGYVKRPRDWKWSTFKRYVKNGIYDVNWGSMEEIKFDDDVGNE